MTDATYAGQYAEALQPRRYALGRDELIASHNSTHHGNLSHDDCPLCREEDGHPPEVPHNTSDVIGLANALTDEDRHPQPHADGGSIRRMVLADALDDAGDADTAQMVRDARNHIVWHGGRIQRGKFQYGDVTFHTGDDYPEAEQRMDDDGPEGAAEYLQQWDYGDAPRHYFDEPQWGSGDRTHDVKLWSGRSPVDAGKQHYVLSHNPRLGYMGLAHVREVPHDTPTGSE